ncbi:tetratricopeptide repeat protein [Acanthopleuribacter pedis]|uniref:Tetratricopeptide repeat protein n=1 Tax=Acanthopleuribacter pedis TaxID=442870 RepID=A0A8J7PZA0_9BACT|nr:tetratricopeptide repeat protein [Acanthopleuribacter pedis]MBO1317452.1 tetratricopeptide repeat protein [Acanthopleuribacter pedis]
MLQWLIPIIIFCVGAAVLYLLRGHCYIFQARGLVRRGKHRRALKWLERAVAVNRHHAEAWLLLAKTLFALERWDEATAPFRKALLLNPDKAAEIHCDLGRVLGALDDRVGAIAAIKETLRLDPRHALGFYYLGEQFFLKGEFNHAAEAVQRALDLEPGMEAAQQLRKRLDATKKSA